MNVLWIDDDSPSAPQTIDGVKVVSAQSLSQAEELIKKSGSTFDWIVVDLIVPQNGWCSSLLSAPGLTYIRHLKDQLGDKVGLTAYGVALTDGKRRAAKAAGAQSVYEKMRYSWTDVLREIQHVGGRQGEVI
jgi:hypothetical protein